MVSPYDVSGSRMAVLALHPAIVSFLDMVRVAPGWRLEEIEVRPGARLDGTTIGQIRAAHPEVRILAVTQRGAGYSAFPAPEMTLGPGDLVLLLGPASDVRTRPAEPSGNDVRRGWQPTRRLSAVLPGMRQAAAQ